MEDILARFTSRKFLIAVAAIMIQLLSAYIGGISPVEAADAIWKIALGYIGVEGGIDLVSAFRHQTAEAPAASAGVGD